MVPTIIINLSDVLPNLNMPEKQPSENSKELYKTIAQLSLLKAMLALLEQPFQVVMRHQQAAIYHQQSLSALNACYEILCSSNARQFGVLPTALFRGASPAMIKELLKGCYKAVLFKKAPEFTSKKFSTPLLCSLSPINQHVSIAIMSAMLTSITNTLFSGPLDRYATYRTTSQMNKSDAKFLNDLRSRSSTKDRLQFLYKGFGPAFLKMNIGYLTFFSLSKPIQGQVHKHYTLEPGDNIPVSASTLSIFLTATVVSLSNSPFDIMKTIYQMPHHTTNTNFSMIDLLQDNIRRLGWRGATAGLPIKIVMGMLGWGVITAITQQPRQAPTCHLYLFFNKSQEKTVTLANVGDRQRLTRPAL